MKLAVTLLPHIAQGFLEYLMVDGLYPSPALLCRGRFVMDVGFMSIMCSTFKRLIAEGGFMCGLLDSSPQGGKNWLMMECFYIFGSCLILCFQYSIAMSEFKGRCGDRVLSEEERDLFIEMSEYLQTNFLHHIFAPGGLGARHSNFNHKAHTWMHSHRLESDSWKMVAQLVRLYYGFATDRGAERYIGRLNVDPFSLFPHWVDPGNDDAQDDLDNLFNGPPMVNTTLSHDLAGIFHCIDNVKKRLMKRLPGWHIHGNGLENSSNFFHSSQDRNLYKATCLRGDRLHWQTMFDVGPPKLEGGRVWGVMLKTVTWHLDRRVLLRSSIQELSRIQVAREDANEDGVDDHPECGDGGGESREDRSRKIRITIQANRDIVFFAFLGIQKDAWK
jgi:hypothetical protein